MERQRVRMLDILRGCAMVLVIAYHVLYDLVFIEDIPLPVWLTPYEPVVETVHSGFLWVLFAVSGVCSGYSHNLLRRGVWLSVVGFVITVVSVLWLPEYAIVFGVLSCFGGCMILTALCSKVLDAIPWPILTVLGVLLWMIFMDFSKGVLHLLFTDVTFTLPKVEYLYPLGIVGGSFYSIDYFPLIPFIFMFWTGRGLYRPISKRQFPAWFYKARCPVLEWMGRHSLLIYVVHQPILLLFFMLI